MREVPEAAVELVKRFEGIGDGDPTTVNLDPYLDPIKIWTIGWGHAIRVDGMFLRGPQNKERAFALYPGGITRAQAETLLRADLITVARDVLSATRIELTEGQFAALISFVFNEGIQRFLGSAMRRFIIGGDFIAAAMEFPHWRLAGGKPWPGLVERRAAERAIFES